jgi:hypothetical protein
MSFGGSLAPRGITVHRLLKGGSLSRTPARELSLREIFKHGFPHPGLCREVFVWRLRNLPNLWRALWKILIARLCGIPHFYGQLSLVVKREGRIIDFGLASLRVVTDTGVGYIVDAFQNLVELENMKFHGYGTGTNAEAAGNTALQTELTTQYATDSTRPTGSTTEGASANIYRTVATLSPDSGGTIAITEHGIFSASSSGVLLDRSVFSAINLVAGSDSLQTTYDFTITSGS